MKPFKFLTEDNTHSFYVEGFEFLGLTEIKVDPMTEESYRIAIYKDLLSGFIVEANRISEHNPNFHLMNVYVLPLD